MQPLAPHYRREMTPAGLPMLALFISGCPFVFGAPDLSNVDRAETDAGTTDTGTTDTDTTGTDTDTGTTDTAAPEPPTLSLLSARRLHDAVYFEFMAANEDLDLDGGSIIFETPTGESLSFSIPTEIDVWRSDGISEIRLPAPFLDCETGDQTTWTAYVVDDAGLQSTPQAISLDVLGLGMFEESPYAHDAGFINQPTVACLNFEGELATLEEDLQNDLEGVNFRVLQEGEYTFTIGWTTNMDVDLYLYDMTTFPGVVLDMSLTYYSAWESVTKNLQPGITYQLVPSFWATDGAPPPYRVTALFEPE